MKLGLPRINGKTVSRRAFLKKRGKLGVPACPQTFSEARPFVSESSGVLPNQVPEARALIEERGLVGVEVLPSGRVRCSCRGKAGKSGRNGWMDLRGKTDQDGGLGDV